MARENSIWQRWVTAVQGASKGALVPGVAVTGVGLGVAGWITDRPAAGTCGALGAAVAALVEQKRAQEADLRVERLKARARDQRSRVDHELADLRNHLRSLDRQLWEYRLSAEQQPVRPAARVSDEGIRLARPYASGEIEIQASGELWGEPDTSRPQTPPAWPAVRQPAPTPAPALRPAAAERAYRPDPPSVELPVLTPSSVMDLLARSQTVLPAPEPGISVEDQVYAGLDAMAPAGHYRPAPRPMMPALGRRTA